MAAVSLDATGVPLTATISMSGSCPVLSAAAAPLTATVSMGGGFPAYLDASGTPLIAHVLMGGTITPYVYVADSGNHRINVYDYDGIFLFSFGSYGTGEGAFDSPYGVCSDDAHVWVTDTNNARIQKFTLKGVFIEEFGTSGTGDGEFNAPYGISVDERFLYIVDHNNDRLQFWDKNNHFYLTSVTKFEGIDFSGPTNVSNDDAFIYLDDTGNSRIVILPKLWLPDIGMLFWWRFDMVVAAEADTRSIAGNLIWPELDWILSATASTGNVLSGALRWQDWNVTAYTGGEGSLIWPDWTVTAAGTSGAVATGSLRWPDWTLSGELDQENIATGDLILGDWVITAEGQAGYVAIGALVWPDWTVSGELLAGNEVTGSLIWPDWTVSGTIKGGSIITGALVWPDFKLYASTLEGNDIDGALIWPDWNIEGNLISDSILYGDLIFPELFVTGVISSDSASAEYTCYAVNIHNKAVSQYRNWPFTGFAKFKGRYLATDGSTGIYELTGATDNGTAITSRMKFRIEDLAGAGNKHRIKEVWYTGESDGAIELFLEEKGGDIIPLKQTQLYRTGDMLEIRFKAPRGLKGRFYSLILETNKPFDLHMLRLFDESNPERVR